MKVKECPHCGGKAELKMAKNGAWVVKCVICGCGTNYGNKEKVLAAWNRRG